VSLSSLSAADFQQETNQYIFQLYSDVNDGLKFLARILLNPKFRSINIIMTSYLQKLRHIFCQVDFTLLPIQEPNQGGG